MDKAGKLKLTAVVAAVAAMLIFHQGIGEFLVIIAVGMLVILIAVLCQEHQRAHRKRDNPPVPPDTPGARQCLKCKQAFPAGTPGPCPACQGTLARSQGVG